MARTDLEILNNAVSFEARNPLRAWEASDVGASRADINRLVNAEFIQLRSHSSRVGPDQYGPALYKITEKGRKAAVQELEVYPQIAESELIEAFSLIVGFDDIKETLAHAIAMRQRIHFLMEGPPACAKSLFLDAIRNCVPNALMVFGSRTSGRGLSDLLFEKKPQIVLADEMDKMRHDIFSLTLGLMEAGEIIEAKSGDTRGIKLPNTMVIGACNSSKKMPPEFLSRFAFHPKFPHYTREEFIDVVRSMLSRVESCPVELSELIAEQVFDNGLGDVRQARGVWQLMRAPTREEVIRVLRMKAKYSTGAQTRNPRLKRNPDEQRTLI
jgi:hypothetical protein